jgi:hypothetical protein
MPIDTIQNVQVSVSDVGDSVLIKIYELGAGLTTHLTDLMLKVDRGTHPNDPVAGVKEIYLPDVWEGKRIRVTRNGFRFYTTRYTRTTDGIELLGDDETGPDEEFGFENY